MEMLQGMTRKRLRREEKEEEEFYEPYRKRRFMSEDDDDENFGRFLKIKKFRTKLYIKYI